MKTELYVNNDIGLDSYKFKQVLELLGKYFPKVYDYKKPVKTYEQVLSFVAPVLKHVLKHNPSFRNVVIINLDKTINSCDKPHKVIFQGRDLYFRNVDLSRTVDINGLYVEHHIGLLNSIPCLDNTLFLLYDSDIVQGYGIKLLEQAILKKYKDCFPDALVHFEPATPFHVREHQELLDLSDLTTRGIVLHKGNGIRLPYLTNEFTLNKYVSIPEEHYMEFKKAYHSILAEDEEVTKLVDAMHQWAIKHNRKSFIIGVSGGIDSAVCLGLLCNMRDKYPTANYSITPVIAPIGASEGTTGQVQAAKLALDYTTALGFSPKDIVYKNLSAVSNTVNKEYCMEDSPQLQQQADYWLRPQLFHHIAERNQNSCMVGTVNYAEWYLGWFSQYLDIFNLMPIVHLHKSSVVRLGQVLNVPNEIIEAQPSGGLANGNTDEQSFGFTYDELEKFLAVKDNLFPEPCDYLRMLNALGMPLVESIQAMNTQSNYKRDRFNPEYIFAIIKSIEP